MNKIKSVSPLREAIWYFQFRPEIKNANKKIRSCKILWILSKKLTKLPTSSITTGVNLWNKQRPPQPPQIKDIAKEAEKDEIIDLLSDDTLKRLTRTQ